MYKYCCILVGFHLFILFNPRVRSSSSIIIIHPLIGLSYCSGYLFLFSYSACTLFFLVLFLFIFFFIDFLKLFFQIFHVDESWTKLITSSLGMFIILHAFIILFNLHWNIFFFYRFDDISLDICFIYLFSYVLFCVFYFKRFGIYCLLWVRWIHIAEVLFSWRKSYLRFYLKAHSF